jgi:hypothetical protein
MGNHESAYNKHFHPESNFDALVRTKKNGINYFDFDYLFESIDL